MTAVDEIPFGAQVLARMAHRQGTQSVEGIQRWLWELGYSPTPRVLADLLRNT